MPFALTDLRKYAKRGDEISVVNTTHGDVLIVEAKGILFPCRVELISDVKPEPIEEVKVIEFKPQLSLFWFMELTIIIALLVFTWIRYGKNDWSTLPKHINNTIWFK